MTSTASTPLGAQPRAPGRDVAVRVGVIGTGVMGADHVRTLHGAVSGARVAAVADVDPHRAAAAVAGLPGVAVVGDPHALIEDAAVDAVLIASSDATHEQYVLAALAAGKPVLCEKPLAPTVDGCRRILEAEAALPRRLVSVGFMRRYDPGYGRLKSLLAAGQIGPPLLMHCVHRNPSAPPDQPTDVLLTGSAVHEIDVTRWLLAEEITRVSVHRPRRSSLVVGTTHDPLLVLLETASGVLVDIEVFVNAQYGYDVRCELVGERGAATVRAEPGPVVRGTGTAARTVPADWRERFADAYRVELQDWVDGVATGVANGASAWDGYVATAVARAAVDALGSGLPASVSLPGRPAAYGSGG